MLSFRQLPDARTPPPTTLGELTAFLSALWRPGRFYMGTGLRLAWQFEAEQTLPWEIFRGRLLDPAQTRAERRFLAWNLFQVEGPSFAAEPMLSMLVDPADDLAIHVTRGILCHVWQSAGHGNVIEAQETTRWVRERVGTARLADFPDAQTLRDELTSLLWHAVVGTSRLPLHSLEAPLPAFVLGQFAYVPRGETENLEQPLRLWPELIVHAWPQVTSEHERAKLLETMLRTIAHDDVANLAGLLGESATPGMLRRLFNNVSLSPYTDFVAHALALPRELVAQGFWTEADELDFLCHLVRLQNRHLNAYDLVTFHHRGANYPDALLLDAVLQRLLLIATARAPLFDENPDRRQALLFAWQIRRHYEGLAVPAQPTSPGENARVMPWPRLGEDEILQTVKRRHTLFKDRPLTALTTPAVRAILAAALADLRNADPCYQLGAALFIDRPLGYAKAAIEPDQTPLVAHECFSPSLMRRRLADLAHLAASLDLAVSAPILEQNIDVAGIPVDQLAADPRPCASLADARKVAADFVLVRTMPVGLRDLLACLDASDLVATSKRRALVHLPGPDERRRLTLCENDEPRYDFLLDPNQGWTQRAGLEFPRHTKIERRES